ncbi:MAG: ABC transporter ATP-binding protein [Desulfobacteraceae bacterium 4572_88]|nr:MAG: ABC transporter ATP-binding protein [Desulfobacteraceae bacterium 4572_88]
MIGVENLSKYFGAQTLFEDVTFKLNSRERLGVVGRNGHGKTTLFRMLIGEELPDSGSIVIPKNYRIGYVEQHISFTEDTVLKEGMKGLPEQEKDHHWKVEKVLAGLGFSDHDMERHPGEFSGGYQVRLNLAKMLVSDPDLLLLDEPTNYLDITSIRWVVQFLITWPHELMLITHDRSFMDKVVTHTMAIHRKKVRKVPGDTGKLYSQIAQEEEIYEKTRMNDERKQKDIEQFITRFRAKARLANMVQSRVKTLEKMGKREKLETVQNLDFSFRNKPFPGKNVMRVSNLSFSYDPQTPLIRDFSISVSAGDRICVVGKNGKGKTTLLKLLADAISPRQGEVVYNPNVEKGFYEQTNVSTLVDTRTVEEELLYADADVDRQQARNICGAMMFKGDDALKRIGVLSGGEKSRVMLGKLLVTPLNLLLLDEPTNHLDMESCDAMLGALDSFAGVVVMVTHNEMFLHALAERLIVFQNDRIRVFEGSYQEFLEKGGWEGEFLKDQAEDMASDAEDQGEDAVLEKLSRKELKRRRSEIINERAKEVKPLKQRIAKVENAIEKHEEKLEELNEAMQKASQAQDGGKITEISQSIHTCQFHIDTLFDDLESLSESFDEKNALFESRLAQLEGQGGDV